jgi:hypothetical protein
MLEILRVKKKELSIHRHTRFNACIGGGQNVAL